MSWLVWGESGDAGNPVAFGRLLPSPQSMHCGEHLQQCLAYSLKQIEEFKLQLAMCVQDWRGGRILVDK